MIYEVVLPKLGVTMEEGTLAEWYKKDGDNVTEGEKFFIVETEKTEMEVEATVTGKIIKLIHPAGTTLKAGQVVALVGTVGEDYSEDVIKNMISKIEAREAGSRSSTWLEQEPRASVQVGSGATDARVRATPSARRFMRG